MFGCACVFVCEYLLVGVFKMVVRLCLVCVFDRLRVWSVLSLCIRVAACVCLSVRLVGCSFLC